MGEDRVHLNDCGELQSIGMFDYSYFEAEAFVCSVCGQELDINDGDYIGTREEYEYFKSKGWQPEHGKPRRLYPRVNTTNG